MGLTNFLRRWKLTYVVNNLLHAKELKRNKALYRKYGIKKSVFSPISSEDFPETDVRPWLDEQNSRDVLPQNEVFKSLPDHVQSELIDWSDNGFVILKGFFKDEADQANELVADYLDRKGAQKRYRDGRLMFGIRKIPALGKMIEKDELNTILELLIGKRTHVFQSINFRKGTQQKAHSDSYHMTTFPQGFLIAAWIALEDIDETMGPIFYYPGSHKLPYLMNDSFDHGGSSMMIGNENYANYEAAIKDLIEKKGLEKKQFTAKKGDVLIWHANLLHGGDAITKEGSTRKSMVLHYYTDDVICFHEITQRPAIFTV